MDKTALLIVDLQNDFCPGGTLAVPDGDKIVPVANDLIAVAMGRQMPIFVSRDWHPSNHCSFKEQGGPWPKHCVQSTKGAELHPNLKLPKNSVLISKGVEQDKDSYSAFGGTNLENLLREKKVRKIFIGGLALDYCVKATALDGQKLGFDIVVFQNATRAVNINPSDGWNAKAEMWDAGISIIQFPGF